jgi:hypothetical protein
VSSVVLLLNIMKLSSPAFFEEKSHNHKLKSGSAAAATMHKVVWTVVRAKATEPIRK